MFKRKMKLAKVYIRMYINIINNRTNLLLPSINMHVHLVMYKHRYIVHMYVLFAIVFSTLYNVHITYSKTEAHPTLNNKWMDGWILLFKSTHSHTYVLYIMYLKKGEKHSHCQTQA